MARPKSCWKTWGLVATGMSGILAGVVIMVFLWSAPALGNTLPPGAVLAAGQQAPAVAFPLGENVPASIAVRLAQVVTQPANVNGRLVYAVPAVVGPDATAILQTIAPNAIVYVVHPLTGWGKSVSTTVSWFRCIDIVSVNQYNGSQVEIENWILLTQQERMEAQAACSLSTFAA
jgi:hypothetical protein